MTGARRIIAVGAAALAVGGAVTACGQSNDYPTCRPHSQKCRQTADDTWVPYWYYASLLRAQHTTRPTAKTGATPTGSEERSAGAPESAVEHFSAPSESEHPSAPSERVAPSVHISEP